MKLANPIYDTVFKVTTVYANTLGKEERLIASRIW